MSVRARSSSAHVGAAALWRAAGDGDEKKKNVRRAAGDGRRLPTQRNAELKTGLNGPRSEEERGGCSGELRLKVGL